MDIKNNENEIKKVEINQPKKITLKDLIARKLEKENSQHETKDIYIRKFNGTLTFHKMPEKQFLKLMDEASVEDIKFSENYYANCKLIYHCCNLFSSPNSQKELEVDDPYDAVSKTLYFDEVFNIANELLEFIGMKDIDETVKK